MKYVIAPHIVLNFGNLPPDDHEVAGSGRSISRPKEITTDFRELPRGRLQEGTHYSLADGFMSLAPMNSYVSVETRNIPPEFTGNCVQVSGNEFDTDIPQDSISVTVRGSMGYVSFNAWPTWPDMPRASVLFYDGTQEDPIESKEISRASKFFEHTASKRFNRIVIRVPRSPFFIDHLTFGRS